MLKFLLQMKIGFCLFMAVCLQVSAHGYSQDKFSFHVRQVGAHEIFNAIKQESKYRFFYNNDYLRQLGKVDLDVTDASLTNILDQVLGGKFGYTIRDGRKVIITPVKQPVSPARPDTAVKGKVTDEGGKPLGGVTVKLASGGGGGAAGGDGSFSNSPANGGGLGVGFWGCNGEAGSVECGRS